MTDGTDSTGSATVSRNDEAGRYEIHVDGVLAGFSEFYVDKKGRVVFPHTEIDPAFGGRGLGGILVGQALTDAASRGETVRPTCPFVVKYLGRNEVAGLTIDWPARRSGPDSNGAAGPDGNGATGSGGGGV